MEIAILWKDLSFDGKSMFGLKSKSILTDLNGYFEFGKINAIMGPSGCGKSTFLKCINGLNKKGLSDKTRFFLNNTKQINACFIVQDVMEHLLTGLTVEEWLKYSSKLKNSEEYSVMHEQNISTLMTELRLSDIKNTLIKYCSGGEQKRIAIAAELTSIKMPNLICIDEPTSGLDSNASEIVRTLLYYQ